MNFLLKMIVSGCILDRYVQSFFFKVYFMLQDHCVASRTECFCVKVHTPAHLEILDRVNVTENYKYCVFPHNHFFLFLWNGMILKYLIPAKLSIGILRIDCLLEKYNLVEACRTYCLTQKFFDAIIFVICFQRILDSLVHLFVCLITLLSTNLILEKSTGKIQLKSMNVLVFIGLIIHDK